MNTLKNKVQLVGNLGIDPVVKNLDNGRSFARFTLATNDSYVKSDGTKVEDTQWHNVIVWGKQSANVQQLLKKGSRVLIQGKLNSREYEDKDGVKRRYHEVVMNDMLLIDGRPAVAAAAA